MYLLEVAGDVSFLDKGTAFLTWLLDGCTKILNFLTSNEVTIYFLVAGLIWIVVRIIKAFVRI